MVENDRFSHETRSDIGRHFISGRFYFDGRGLFNSRRYNSRRGVLHSKNNTELQELNVNVRAWAAPFTDFYHSVAGGVLYAFIGFHSDRHTPVCWSDRRIFVNAGGHMP